MLRFLVSALLGLSGILGVKQTPSTNSIWIIQAPWKTESNGLTTATFSAPINKLGCSPGKVLKFSRIVHGAHQIFMDGNLVETFNDPSMATVRSFYGRPVIECGRLTGQEITWKIFSNTRYFAHFSTWPTVAAADKSNEIFDETANIAAFGALLVLALYLVNGITRGILINVNIVLAILAASFSLYFFMTTPGLMGIHISMFAAHRIADICILIGAASIVKYLSLQKLLPKWLCNTHYGIVLFAFGVIISAQSGDEIQVGTSMPFLTVLITLIYSIAKEIKNLIAQRTNFKIQGIFDLAGLTLFAGTIFNDILYVTGVLDHQMILPLGFVGGTYSFATAVHSWTAEIYKERDHLRQNLEQEVKIQTEKSESRRLESERSLAMLKVAQAELIQSAKLASLGTLAAGISHEINNSINFVSGALRPLDKLVDDLSDVDRRSKIKKLLVVMKDGVDWTVNIVKALRLYTGLNQAEYKEAKVKDLVVAVLNILNGRIRNGVEVSLDIPDDLSIFANIVGVNQIMMNLITNALDAMKDAGKLTISASKQSTEVEITIRDTGSGIAPEIQEKIFDPFFTTKEVGKGTGLGLHIVSQEIKRLNGKIEVKSEVNKGTVFTLNIPILSEAGRERGVA